MATFIEWGDSVDNAQLGVVLSAENYAPWAEVALTIYLKNNSATDEINLAGQFVWTDFAINVFYSDQSPVPRSAFAKSIDLSESFSRILQPLAAGEILTLTLPLNRLFDLTIEDDYEVVVSRNVQFGDNGKTADILSGRTGFTVAEEFGVDFGRQDIL